MPRLSYPGGRQAAAVAKTPEPEKTDVLDPALVEGEQPEKVEAQQDDASVAFQKQIDALRESERIQKARAEQAVKEREDAIRQANEHQAEVSRLKKETTETHFESITNALAAARADAEAAQGELEKAFELGDFKAQAAATNRLSKANTSIATLESGKEAMERQAKEAAEVKHEAPKAAVSQLPPSIQAWLNVHQDYANDPEKIAQINYLHHKVVKEGHTFGSDGYIVSMETHLGMRTKQEQIVNEDDDEPQERRRPSMVSAPVSRDGPPTASGDKPGRVTLSVREKEAAKISGITEKEYAEQKIKLMNEKLNGNYGGAP